jgi:hypothetical protein
VIVSVWFEDDGEIDCDIRQVQHALENHGELYVGVISLMPGLTSVKLVDQESGSVTIRTNEGLMKRTNISTRIEADRVVMEFDERYEAGSKVTVTSHFSDRFTTSDSGVIHRLVISDVAAPGFLGFLYRTFGSSKTGKATMTAYKSHFEKQGAWTLALSVPRVRICVQRRPPRAIASASTVG